MNAFEQTRRRLAAGAAVVGFGLGFFAPAFAASAPAAPAPAAQAPAASAVAGAKTYPAPIASPRKADELCRELVRKLADLGAADCARAALQTSSGKSVRGVPIFTTDVKARRQAGQAADAPRRRVLVIGGIHGDELSSVSLAFNWVGQAMETSGEIDWRFVPVLNPDSVFIAKPLRVNANGVDLNRNFPTPGWDVEAPRYWQERTNRDPRRYPGPKPLSEPESRWLHDEMERFKPNVIVSIHAPYGVLDFDGPTVPPERLGRLYLDQVGIYPGSLGNYGGVHKRVPVVTIELNNAHRAPSSTEMRQMWLDMLRWISERLPE